MTDIELFCVSTSHIEYERPEPSFSLFEDIFTDYNIRYIQATTASAGNIPAYAVAAIVYTPRGMVACFHVLSCHVGKERKDFMRSKKISVWTALLIVLIVAVLTFSITYSTLFSRMQQTEKEYALNENGLISDGEGHTSNSIYSAVDYVDEMYRQYYIGELDDETLSEYLIRGYLAGTGDKYAYYMDPETYAQQMSETTGDSVGIGVHVVWDNETQTIEVIAVTPDSPAQQAGILPGDIITAVDDAVVAQVGYSEAVSRVQGEIGTNVQLTIRRGEETFEFSVQRATIENVSVTYRLYQETIGIIRLYQFSDNTGALVQEAVEALQKQGAQKLIFDVRSNTGGALIGIVNTLDYLLPEGPILHIQGKDGETVQEYTSDAACVEMPMAVLVNETTASAAELFAAALQDYDIATVVGTQTYGKGTVCTIIPLPNGGGISVSTQYYTPPYSDNIEGKGVTPDIVVDLPDDVNVYLVADQDDTQLQAALAALENT